MTVASEIARIQGVKANILDAIATKGVTVPSGATLADCPNLISSISGGGEDIYNVIDYKYYLGGGETANLTDGVLTIKANNSAILLKSVNISSYDEIVFKTKVKYNRATGSYTNHFLVQRINDMCFAIAFNDDFAKNNWCMRVANGRLTYDTYAFVGTDSTTFTSLSTLEIRLKKSTGSIVVKINGTEVLNTVALNPIYFGSDVVIGLGAYTDGKGTFAIGDQVYINETFLIADGKYLIGHQKSGGVASRVSVNYNKGNIHVKDNIIYYDTLGPYVTLGDVGFGSPLASNFMLQLRFKLISSYSTTSAIIGNVPGINYRNFAFHYNSSTKKYWVGFPKLDNSGWNVVVNWKNYEFDADEWYKIKVEFILSTLSVNVYINDILDATGTLPENSSFTSSGIAFGTNYEESYLAQLNIDLNESFLLIDNTRVW